MSELDYDEFLLWDRNRPIGTDNAAGSASSFSAHWKQPQWSRLVTTTGSKEAMKDHISGSASTIFFDDPLFRWMNFTTPPQPVVRLAADIGEFCHAEVLRQFNLSIDVPWDDPRRYDSWFNDAIRRMGLDPWSDAHMQTHVTGEGGTPESDWAHPGYSTVTARHLVVYDITLTRGHEVHVGEYRDLYFGCSFFGSSDCTDSLPRRYTIECLLAGYSKLSLDDGYFPRSRVPYNLCRNHEWLACTAQGKLYREWMVL